MTNSEKDLKVNFSQPLDAFIQTEYPSRIFSQTAMQKSHETDNIINN